jgi:hypothetical protein
MCVAARRDEQGGAITEHDETTVQHSHPSHYRRATSAREVEDGANGKAESMGCAGADTTCVGVLRADIVAWTAGGECTLSADPTTPAAILDRGDRKPVRKPLRCGESRGDCGDVEEDGGCTRCLSNIPSLCRVWPQPSG